MFSPPLRPGAGEHSASNYVPSAHNDRVHCVAYVRVPRQSDAGGKVNGRQMVSIRDIYAVEKATDEYSISGRGDGYRGIVHVGVPGCRRASGSVDGRSVLARLVPDAGEPADNVEESAPNGEI